MRDTNYLVQILNNFTDFRREFIKKKDIKNLILKFIRFFYVPHNYYTPKYRYLGVVKVKTKKNNFKMNASGGILESKIFWKGIYNSLEPETIWIIEKLTQNANCFIDIGANTGLYSLFVKAINPKCNIHAFEPSRNTFKELQENIALNKFEIYANSTAVSNINGFSTFYDTLENHQYSASLSPKMLKENPDYVYEINEYSVEVITLDQYVTRMNISEISLIKIDVELHEPEVVEGMSVTLSKMRPFILFEVLTDEVGEKLSQLLFRSDYKYFHFQKINKGYRLIQVENIVGRTNNEWNYFACHKERIRELENLNLIS